MMIKAASTPTILRIRDLCISVPNSDGLAPIVDGVCLDIAPGERLALVGESGSGKSTIAKSILHLNRGLRTEGSIELCGAKVLQQSQQSLRANRGVMASMIFQDPLSALNPVRTIGSQVMEPLRIRGVSPRKARRRAIEVLERLGVRDAVRGMDSYPHEFSGGMRQRVVIAAAIVTQPSLLIADEPTTALDVRIQEQVLDVLDDYARDTAMSVLLITHDLGIVAGFADRVAVVLKGKVVENGPVDSVFAAPRHAYTRALLDALPRIDGPLDRPLSATHAEGACR